LSRNLIPKAIADNGILSLVNNNSTRTQFSCKHLYFSSDKYGYCCDAAVLFNQDRGLYETEEVDIESSSRICKPIIMFYKASEFNSDISGWDVSAVTNMNVMFGVTSVFNSDVSS